MVSWCLYCIVVVVVGDRIALILLTSVRACNANRKCVTKLCLLIISHKRTCHYYLHGTAASLSILYSSTALRRLYRRATRMVNVFWSAFGVITCTSSRRMLYVNHEILAKDTQGWEMDSSKFSCVIGGDID